jgi:prepilin-type N-terminal cleavage/methylation domain-containing protein
MNSNKQQGFSLIELIMVLVIISILATITFPYLYKAKYNAENGNAVATTRTIVSSQVSFYSQNGRFARLDELNTIHRGSLGTVTSNVLSRGKFTFTMAPAIPDDASLRSGYSITGAKSVSGSDVPFTITVDQTGFINSPFNP